MLHGKKILIGISGSIAAYKIPILVRLLIKAGAEVKVVMTPSSQDFVSRLTLSTLSKHPVLTELFDEASWSNHVALGRWADLMVIAPLSCNTLSKMANGACDNLLLAVYLSATCPVMVAPAMDEDMWLHPSTRQNLARLRSYGNRVLDVGTGELASGLFGPGRMAEPEEMLNAVERFFRQKDQFQGQRVLITAGPTYESIDPVRFIGNQSSGKMGYALADELALRGARVTLVSGPVSIGPKAPGIEVVKVTSAAQMHAACLDRSADYDLAIMAAAVADYTPRESAEKKIKKGEGALTLELVKTEDILAALGKMKGEKQVLVGFALETDNEEANARKKLTDKNADLIVLNSLRDEGAGFGTDTNQVTLFYRDGRHQRLSLRSKTELASDLADALSEMTS